LDLGVEETVHAFPSLLTGSRIDNFQSVKHPDFKFDAGFRLGLSHYSICNCYDVALNWTHLHSKATADGETTVPTTGVAGGDYTIFFPWWERFEGIYPDFSKSHWTLNLDLLDLEFGHKYFVACRFILRPHIGLRGARINQSYRVFSFANRFVTDPDLGFFDSYESEVKAKNNFLAIGPRIGLDLEIDLGCSLALVGEAGASLLFGRFENHNREHLTVLDTEATPPLEDHFDFFSHSHAHRTSRAVTDLAVGLEWNHCFTCCNRSHPVTIAFLWEHHGFFDFTCFKYPSNGYDPSITPAGFPLEPSQYPNCCCGDLFTQGLTLSFRFGF